MQQNSYRIMSNKEGKYGKHILHVNLDSLVPHSRSSEFRHRWLFDQDETVQKNADSNFNMN